MIARLLRSSVQYRWLVVAIFVALALAGEIGRRHLRQDLLPELGDPQVSLVIDWPGHPASEVTARVLRVLTGTLEAMPGAATVRGASMAGMAQITVLLSEGADPSRARTDVAAQVERVRTLLPPDVRLQIGPDAGSASWVYQTALVDPGHRLTGVQLRQLQDEVVRPAVAAVGGVAEVATVGGLKERLMVDLDSGALRARGLAFDDVLAAVRVLLGAGTPALEALQALEIRPRRSSGPSVALAQIARIAVEREMYPGMADLQGGQNVVGGVVIVQRGADVPSVVERVKALLAQLLPRLPAGIDLVTVYDRSEIIARVQRTFRSALAEEIVAMVLVVLVLLVDLRAAVVPLLTLPGVVLLTFGGMWLLGIPATVMSLGGIGIALGLAVDAEVVALEACHRQLESAPPSSGGGRAMELLASTIPVTRAVVVSLLIAALSFLPVLTFAGETGRLLRPLALTKTLVLCSAALVAVTLGPALRSWFVRGQVLPEMANPLTRGLVALYRPVLELALRQPAWTLAIATLALLSAVPVAMHLGGEFLPRVDEGDFLAMPVSAPGAASGALATQLRRQDAALAAFPEVASVFGKLGRAETATDPAPMSMAEINVRLRPREEWPARPHPRALAAVLPRSLRDHFPTLAMTERPDTSRELLERLDQASRLPGWSGAWTAPVRARLDMGTTGIRTPVGLRFSGPDPGRLEVLAGSARALLAPVEGTRSAFVESEGGEPWPEFRSDPALVAARRVDPGRIAPVTAAVLSGSSVGSVRVHGQLLPLELGQDAHLVGPLDSLRALTVRDETTAPGQPVPLALLGSATWSRVPSILHTEGRQLVEYVHLDLEPGTDLARYVDRADRALREGMATGALTLESSERADWIGQYPLLIAGQERLRWVVPLVFGSMLLLLVLQFRSLAEACIVLVSAPFAVVGSLWTLHWLGYSWSAPVWVGLLSAVGLAMQTAVLMVIYVDQALHRRLEAGRLRTVEDIREAHAEGSLQRLRPKVMTVATMIAGLLPLLWSEGAGSEVTRRIAAPMLGGLLTSAFLTLEVLPVLYTLWRAVQLRRAQRLGLDPRDVLYRRTGAAMEGTPEVSTRNSM